MEAWVFEVFGHRILQHRRGEQGRSAHEGSDGDNARHRADAAAEWFAYFLIECGFTVLTCHMLQNGFQVDFVFCEGGFLVDFFVLVHLST